MTLHESESIEIIREQDTESREEQMLHALAAVSSALGKLPADRES